MSGMMIMALGIGLVVVSAVLFVVSIVYQKTVGKKIQEELMREYE